MAEIKDRENALIMETTKALLAHGHEVTVLTPVNGEPTYTVGQVVPLKLKSNLSYLPRKWSNMKRRLHKWDWPGFEFYRDQFIKGLRSLNPRPDAVIVFNDLLSQRFVASICPESRSTTA